ncbi:MAG: hypothetical protein UX14_C0008G0011 [Parcubacteria group bacterium GW2011_GWF1_45_5]|nr:MAG: hypothetical protein UX14_C0008G0011 [Parcubacteria group bacterium GW2011_GWF1_45_5]
MVYCFKIVYAPADGTGHGQLEPLGPRKYVKKIDTENKKHYGNDDADHECSCCAEPEH